MAAASAVSAFRTQKPCINNDILNSTRGSRGSRPDARPASSPASRVPLIKAGQSIGVVMFFVGKSWAADEEIVALLARIAENVSFALDNFERANEKAKADEQKERLTRMFAALSATNEAIMRAKSRTELFELVCEGRGPGRQVQLGQHRPCPSPTATISIWSPSQGRRRTMPAGQGVGQSPIIRKAAGSAELRSARGRPASPTILSTTRGCAHSSRSSAMKEQGRRRVSAAGRWAGRRRDAVHLLAERHVHAGIRRTAAAAGRQRVLCARKFRSCRREG